MTCSKLSSTWNFANNWSGCVQPLSFLLRRIVIEGYGSFETKENPSQDHLVSLQECEDCIKDCDKYEAIDCEAWADVIDSGHDKKSRVDILVVICKGCLPEILLLEGKLGCVENKHGEATQPRHSELKDKYDETINRLKALHIDTMCDEDMYLVVSGKYYAQTKRRLNMWKHCGLRPVVKCICISDVLGIVGGQGLVEPCLTR